MKARHIPFCLAAAIVFPISLYAQGGAVASTSPAADSKEPVTVEISQAVPAEYPSEALAKAIQGTVSVFVVISPDGSVEHAEATGGDPILQDAAIAAAKQYKFKMRQGNQYLPVKCAANLSFDFHPPESGPAVSTVAGQLVHASEFPKIVRVSETVLRGLVLKRVNPEYPPEAAKAGIAGTVVISAIIGQDGKVKDVQLLSGSPTLASGAENAVRQWEYRPYLLLGEPVEVETQITMKFGFSSDTPPAEDVKWMLAFPSGSTISHLPIHESSPFYPAAAKAKNKRGKVVVGAMASQDGKLDDLKILDGNRLFNDAALEAVKQEQDKFNPNAGNKIVHVTVIVEFIP
jgi:TonB family protein